MKIVIDPFDKKSINEAIKQLDAYKKDFLKKEKLFLERLADLGVSVATTGFEQAEYDGVKDVQVSMERNGSKATVYAYGETVGFIEFGTGIKNPEYNSAGLEYTPPKHGTYGKGKGAQPWGWWFTPADGGKGVHTYGNKPAEAMLRARNEMIENVTRIAKEVWR